MRYLVLTCTKESSSSSPEKPSPQARGFGIDAIFIHKVAEEIAAVHALGCEIGIVVGGGNFFRGVAQQAIDMDRVAADHMGMLSTVINAIALQDAIEKLGINCRVMSAIEIHQVAEPYIRRRAMRHLEKGRIVIFAAGTGNPFFSTDTAASLRAMEIKADILLKATSVDGIYTADPKNDPDATKFTEISYATSSASTSASWTPTAVSLCRDNNMPMMVFSMREPGNIVRVVRANRWAPSSPPEAVTLRLAAVFAQASRVRSFSAVLDYATRQRTQSIGTLSEDRMIVHRSTLLTPGTLDRTHRSHR